jgi:hypothetical protein
MMNPMVRRGVENLLEKAQGSDESCMYPELINEIETMHGQKHPRSKPQEHYRYVEKPMGETAEPTLPDSDGKIVVPTRMMNDVKVPKEP